MAEKETTILEVMVDTKKAEQELDSVRASMLELMKAYENGEVSQREFTNGMKSLEKEEQQLTKITHSQAGSYDQLSAQYSRNKKELNAMSYEQRYATDAGRELEAQSRAIYEKMNEMQKATGKYVLQVGNYEIATKDLRGELKDLTFALQTLKLEGKENSKEYQELLTRAGELKDAMGDTAQAINKTASDTSNLDAILGAASAASGGFAVATSAMSMLGLSTDSVSEAQKKLQESIALVTGVQAISNAVNKDSALMLKLVSLQSAAAAKAKALETKSTIGATIAQKAFNVVAKANPYVLLATAIISVVGALVLFSSKSDEAKEKQDALNFSMRMTIASLEQVKNNINLASQAIQKFGGDDISASERQIESLSTSVDILTKKIQKLEEESAEATEDPKKLRELAEEQHKLNDEKEIAQKQIEDLKRDLPFINEQLKLMQKNSRESEAAKKTETSLANQIKLLQKKAALSSARNNGATDYEIEEKIAELERKRINNQLVNIKNQKTAANDELDLYKRRVNANTELSDTEKQRLINNKTITTQQKLGELALEQQNAQNEIALLNLDKQLREINRINKAKEVQRSLDLADESRQEEQLKLGEKVADSEYNVLKTRLEASKDFHDKSALAEMEHNKTMSDLTRQANEEQRTAQREQLQKLYEIEHDADLTDMQKKEEAAKVNAFYEEQDLKNKIYYNNLKLSEQERYNNELKDLNTAELLEYNDLAQGYASTTSAFMKALADVQKTTSRKGFERAKALQIGEATVGMISGAVQTFATTMAAGGAYALPKAVAAASSVVAQGMANIAKIRATQFGGTSSAVTNAANARTTTNVSETILQKTADNLKMTAQQPTAQQVLVVEEVTAKQMQLNNAKKIAVQ